MNAKDLLLSFQKVSFFDHLKPSLLFSSMVQSIIFYGYISYRSAVGRPYPVVPGTPHLIKKIYSQKQEADVL
jgi:hypothetical protein